MKVEITDVDVLRSISFTDMLALFRVLGWSQAFHESGRMAVYRKELEGDTAEVLLPLSAEASDYARLIRDAISVIAETERLSELQLLTNIRNVNSDIVRIRAMHGGFQDGTIPLESGRKLIDKAIELFIAGAQAADSPRAVFATRRTIKVTEFLKSTRLGQTEQGSYIVTLKVLIPPTLVELSGQQGLPPVLDVPFERQVTTRLMQALSVAKESVSVASASGKFEPFEQGIPKGVSANLLDAVVSLISETGADETEIRTDWSATRQQDEITPASVMFSSADEPILKEAGRVLRHKNPQHEHTIEGFVRILERKDETSPGLITIKTVLDGKQRTVKLRLEPEEYKQAIAAHGDWRAIRVTGDLIRQGNIYELTDPKGFELYDEEAEPQPVLLTEENADDATDANAILDS